MRRGAVLWLAAEGEREVDKRMRAAVKALGCDPDEQPTYEQIASVPKLLSNGGEALIMQIVDQVQRAAKAEFGLPLVLIIIDTMIKSAGYKKSENDSVEINNMIQVMENISISERSVLSWHWTIWARTKKRVRGEAATSRAASMSTSN